MSKPERSNAIASLVIFCVLAAAQAASVRTLNLVDLTSRAERVFHGRCLKVQPQPGFSSTLPVVEYTFVVEQAIKGVVEGETVVFRQIQSSKPGRPGLPGMPTYEPGQELVLFLKKESRLGLTSPVGLGQGAFMVRRDTTAPPAVANLVGNSNLAVGLEPESLERAGLRRDDYRQLRAGRAIRLERFASMVERLVRSGRPGNRNR